ncbi:TPA: hypothetical protein ACGO4F_000783 [Streptococcus suis]
MPAVRAVDGGLCAVGAGGEVARGVGRQGSAIYGKENDMNELEKTVLNELVRTVGIILEKVENIECQLEEVNSSADSTS